MIFGSGYDKYPDMKNILVILLTGLFVSSCASSRETASAKEQEKKLKQEEIANAIFARRFVVNFDRIYTDYGGIINLIPKSNYLIIDGERAILNAAYFGRKLTYPPIAGINIKGKAEDYRLTRNTAKGSFEIQMEVMRDKSRSFDVYLKVNSNGKCDASVNSIRIDNVRYSGHIVPLPSKNNPKPANDTQALSLATN